MNSPTFPVMRPREDCAKTHSVARSARFSPSTGQPRKRSSRWEIQSPYASGSIRVHSSVPTSAAATRASFSSRLR